MDLELASSGKISEIFISGLRVNDNMRRILIHVFIGLAIPVIVWLVCIKLIQGPDAGKWSLVYTLVSGIISVLVVAFDRFSELQREFSDLSGKFDGLPQVLGIKVTNDEIFKTNSIAQYLLRITEYENHLYSEIALRKIRELRICLSGLKNKQYIAQGPEVYDIYTQLIMDLREGDEYLATTYASDTFWNCSGGQTFFEANQGAIDRGARITRVFLYKRGDDISNYDVVQKHLKLHEELKRVGKESSLNLYKIEQSKVEACRYDHVAEDKGILKDTYVMSLDQEPNSGWQKAIISISNDVVAEDKGRFVNLLRHQDLDPL